MPSLNILTIVLLILQLCLPVYGPAYFSEVAKIADTGPFGVVCAHAEVDVNREPHESHSHKPPCHELDAPCDLPSGMVLSQKSIIAPLIATDQGILLPGYGAPFDIPPEYLL